MDREVPRTAVRAGGKQGADWPTGNCWSTYVRAGRRVPGWRWWRLGSVGADQDELRHCWPQAGTVLVLARPKVGWKQVYRVQEVRNPVMVERLPCLYLVVNREPSLFIVWKGERLDVLARGLLSWLSHIRFVLTSQFLQFHSSVKLFRR